MALTAQQKIEVRASWGRDISFRRVEFPLSKPDLDAAIAATDTFIENNAPAYNLVLPLAARTALTPSQKAELFSLVAQKRYGG